MDSLSGETTLPLSILHPPQWWSAFTGENLLLQEQTLSLKGIRTTVKGIDIPGKQTGSHKSYFPWTNVGKQDVPIHIKSFEK